MTGANPCPRLLRLLLGGVFSPILASVLDQGAIAAAVHPEVSHGTLIVPVLTKDALLVCSDRRRLLLDKSRVDVQKVFSVGANALYGASGTTLVIIPGSPARSFDVHAIAQAYFHQKGRLAVDDVVPGLPDRLSAAVTELFRGVEPARWRAGSKQADTDLFRIVVFLASNRIFSAVDVSCRLDVGQLALTPTVVHSVNANYADRFQLIGGSGTLEIGRQLIDPSDVLWKDIRADPVMAKVLLSKTSIRSSLSVRDAEYFARTLIRSISSRKARLGFEDDVSPESDCFLLSDDGTVSTR